MPEKPSEKILERARETVQERYDASEKVIDANKPKWQECRDLFESNIKQRNNSWESNLIMPKGDQIIETISPRIMSTIFGAADWLTVKNPRLDKFADNEKRDFNKFMMFVHDKKIRFYMMCAELFKDSPIVGTSICKVYPKGRWPVNDFVRIEDFGPDALCNKPGDIDSMRYCYHKFERSLEQLKRFVNVKNEPIYFNLEGLEDSPYAKRTITVKGTDGGDTSVPEKVNPVFDIVEYHGEFEVEKSGKFREYTMAAIVYGGRVVKMIRCDPSQNKIYDALEKREIYYKPFVASIYQIIPGKFYGKSALHAVLSLVAEQKEHHDLFLDQHKRNLTNIIQVLNRSNLTEDDIVRKPDSIWWLDSHDDVLITPTPDLNIQSFDMIHNMLNREIEQTSRANPNTEGIGTTKRQTLGEFEGLRSESNMVFNLFIQLSDRLTLRPIVTRNFNIMRRIFNLLSSESNTFSIGDQYVEVNPEFFSEDVDFQFAATGIETEYSKYSKREAIPKLLSSFAQLISADPNGAFQFDLPKVANDVGDLYNFPNSGEYIKLREGVVPIDLLMQASEMAGIPPEIMQQQILPMVQQMAEEQASGKGREEQEKQ